MSVTENLTGPNRLLSCLKNNFNYNLVDKTKLSSEDTTKAAPKFLSKLIPFALITKKNNWYKLTCLNYTILKLDVDFFVSDIFTFWIEKESLIKEEICQ